MVPIFALILWFRDQPITGNVINLNNVKRPRKEPSEYEVGERVSALCHGFGVCEGVIAKIEGEDKKKTLQSILSDTLEFKGLVDKFCPIEDSSPDTSCRPVPEHSKQDKLQSKKGPASKIKRTKPSKEKPSGQEDKLETTNRPKNTKSSENKQSDKERKDIEKAAQDLELSELSAFTSVASTSQLVPRTEPSSLISESLALLNEAPVMPVAVHPTCPTSDCRNCERLQARVEYLEHVVQKQDVRLDVLEQEMRWLCAPHHQQQFPQQTPQFHQAAHASAPFGNYPVPNPSNQQVAGYPQGNPETVYPQENAETFNGFTRIDQSSAQSRPLSHMMHRPLPAIPPGNGSVTNNGLPNQRVSLQSSSSEEDPFLAYSPKSVSPRAKGQSQSREHKDKYGRSRLVQDSSPVHRRNKDLVNGRRTESSPHRDGNSMKPANGHINANVLIQNKRHSEPIYRTTATQTFGESKQLQDPYGVRPHSVPNPHLIYGVKVGNPGQAQYHEDIYDERKTKKSGDNSGASYESPISPLRKTKKSGDNSGASYESPISPLRKTKKSGDNSGASYESPISPLRKTKKSGDNSGASYESPISPLRLDSLRNLDRSYIEDESLRHCSWYQPGIPREIALDILQQEEIGSFIVRDSTTHPGFYALSVKVPKFENPSGISHYLILKTQRGVKLKGLDKEWSNLTALVTHHTVMPEMLPCTLRLPRNNKNPTFKASDKDDKEEDPDYQRLSDFSSMMDALNTKM